MTSKSLNNRSDKTNRVTASPDSKHDGFCIVPNLFVDDLLKEIGPHAASVYLVLMRHAGASTKCWPSHRKLASITGMNRRTVMRALDTLEESGLISRGKRGRFNGNIYILSSARGTPLNRASSGFSGAPQSPQWCTSVTSSGAPRSLTKGRRHSEEDTKKKTHSSCRSLHSDEDAATADFIWQLIKQLLPNAKKPNLEKWANTVRLMGQRDGRTHQEIRQLFAWANADDFWQSNVLSPEKLRKQWDQLSLKRQNNRRTTHAGNGQQRQQRTIEAGHAFLARSKPK